MFKAKDEGRGPRERGEEDGEGSGCHTKAAGEVRAGVIQFPRHLSPLREEKRKAKRLRKMGLTEEEEMAEKIGFEERKLLIAQRKLESIRLLDELLERVKVTCRTFI